MGENDLRPLLPGHPDDETFSGLLIVRPEGRLFFANAQHVSDRIRTLVTQRKPHVLVLDLSRVFDIEYSALQMMMEGDRRYAEEGVVVWLAGLNPDVQRYIQSSGFADRLGEKRLFVSARAAVRRYLDTFAPDADHAAPPLGPDPSD